MKGNDYPQSLGVEGLANLSMIEIFRSECTMFTVRIRFGGLGHSFVFTCCQGRKKIQKKETKFKGMLVNELLMLDYKEGKYL